MNHVPVTVWDINGDGRSEVLYHSGPGHSFPDNFYAEAGPDEMLTAVDGATGKIVWQTPWPGHATTGDVYRGLFTWAWINRPRLWCRTVPIA